MREKLDEVIWHLSAGISFVISEMSGILLMKVQGKSRQADRILLTTRKFNPERKPESMEAEGKDVYVKEKKQQK